MFLQTKLPSKKPDDVEKAVIRLLLPFKNNVLTITTDNGIEFRNHKSIQKHLDARYILPIHTVQGKKERLRMPTRHLGNSSPKGLISGRLRRKN